MTQQIPHSNFLKIHIFQTQSRDLIAKLAGGELVGILVLEGSGGWLWGGQDGGMSKLVVYEWPGVSRVVVHGW